VCQQVAATAAINSYLMMCRVFRTRFLARPVAVGAQVARRLLRGI
jgi:hypothetical protein